jgi:hypothetical protein
VGLAKSHDNQPLSSDNDDYDDGGNDDNDDTRKFLTNCTIRSSDAATSFGHKSQPFSRQLQHLRTHTAC